MKCTWIRGFRASCSLISGVLGVDAVGYHQVQLAFGASAGDPAQEHHELTDPLGLSASRGFSPYEAMPLLIEGVSDAFQRVFGDHLPKEPL